MQTYTGLGLTGKAFRQPPLFLIACDGALKERVEDGVHARLIAWGPCRACIGEGGVDEWDPRRAFSSGISFGQGHWKWDVGVGRG